MNYLIFLAFAATIPAANWLISNVGTYCIPNGPCLLPVGFGLSAPSGVLMVGVALVLRDAIQERLGTRFALAAIALGTVLSAFFAPPALVIASTAAFLLAELADMTVYTPLRKHHMFAAILVSGAIGAVVDSAVFLWLAFGSLDFMAGQVLGKLWMSLAAAFLLVAYRRCWFGHDMRYDELPEEIQGWGLYAATCARCGHHESDSNRYS